MESELSHNEQQLERSIMEYLLFVNITNGLQFEIIGGSGSSSNQIGLPKQCYKYIKNLVGYGECTICTNNNNILMCYLPCCNQSMCSKCTKGWFNDNINCPYCRQSLQLI